MLKKLLTSLFLFALPTLAEREYISVSTTANTPVRLLSEPRTLHSLTLIGGSSNTRFVLYDSGSTSTNYTRVAYTRPVSYTTNYTVVWTNVYGTVITNTFSGVFTTTESVAGGTVERPRLLTVTVQANERRQIVFDPPRVLTLGLLGVSSVAGVIEAEVE